MSILDLQIADGASPRGTGALMREGTGTHDLRLSFTTEMGGDVQESFTVRVSAKGYAKGACYESRWRDFEADVPASKCNETRPHSGGRVSWSVPLSLVGSLASAFGPWEYSGRSHDTATFEVSVRANWSEDVMGVGGSKADWHSEWACAELYMGFLAKYRLSRAYYETSDLLVVEYTTTWTRQDDRFAVQEDSYVAGDAGGADDAGSGGAVVTSEVWGTVAAPGRIEVPASRLARHLAGKRAWLHVGFNPVYRPYIVGRAESMGYLDVGDRAECNSCTLALGESADPYAVLVETGDAGDAGSEITQVTVKARTATGYSSQATVDVGEPALLKGCPLNVPITIEGVGTNGYAVSKKTTVVEAPAIAAKGVCIVESAEGADRVLIRYNQAYRVSSDAECDTVKLAGRERPSSFYGRGGTTRVEVSGVLLDDDGTALERIATEGDCYIRLPDGRAYRCVPSVSLDWDFSRLRNVTVTGEEVA